MSELNLNEMEEVSGGLVVDDPEKNKFWIIRPNGTDMKEYKAKFGRDLVW